MYGGCFTRHILYESLHPLTVSVYQRWGGTAVNRGRPAELINKSHNATKKTSPGLRTVWPHAGSAAGAVGPYWNRRHCLVTAIHE